MLIAPFEQYMRRRHDKENINKQNIKIKWNMFFVVPLRAANVENKDLGE